MLLRLLYVLPSDLLFSGTPLYLNLCYKNTHRLILNHSSVFLQLHGPILSLQKPRRPSSSRCHSQVKPSPQTTQNLTNKHPSFIPVFLGGINHGSGNKPPWTLPAKAKYGFYDIKRAKKYHDLELVETPDFFPPVTLLVSASILPPDYSKTENISASTSTSPNMTTSQNLKILTLPAKLQPQRALCYIKSTFSPTTFESIWHTFFRTLWTPPQTNITVPASLHSVLTNSNLFTPQEVEAIMSSAAEKEWKDKLLENTQKALELGAFGAPWMWVRNAEGVEEPFFGSDRYVYFFCVRRC